MGRRFFITGSDPDKFLFLWGNRSNLGCFFLLEPAFRGQKQHCKNPTQPYFFCNFFLKPSKAAALEDNAVACIGWGSAAWAVQSREEFVGWTQPVKNKNLHFVMNNTRYLVLP
jgi:hypothetical protein